jgi:hypothetical protein
MNNPIDVKGNDEHAHDFGLHLSRLLSVSVRLSPGAHSASNRNENQKQKNVSGEKSAAGA